MEKMLSYIKEGIFFPSGNSLIRYSVGVYPVFFLKEVQKLQTLLNPHWKANSLIGMEVVFSKNFA